jgi:hypothetical protein
MVTRWIERIDYDGGPRIARLMALPNRAAVLVSADDSRSSIVLAANYVWPRSHSPAAAPVRGRSIGLATTDRPLEGDPGKDMGYSIPSLAPKDFAAAGSTTIPV